MLPPLNPPDGTLHYINTSREEPLIFANGQIKSRIGPTGPAVSMLPERQYEVHRMDLLPGETLLLYTGGVADALNPSSERFSEERLSQMPADASASAGSLIEALITAVDMHMTGSQQFDDITLLSFHRKA
ncbi:MAG TPA: PP2C family protein-serine/threonine phosphatase [Anaerolineales bacterium]|nr:PP2C family protein-serine/threonine phosphatase [Anaerolineales bacterium]